MTAADASLTLDGLSASAGRFALGPIDLRVHAGRVLVVLGPSGAGKTTLLDAIAGFRDVAAGRLMLAGRELTRLAPERRAIGIVFQHAALFPHLSVRENVRFGPRARGDASVRRVQELLARFGLEHHADRRPGTLSGGERQRVALARALAADPRLLLLDEPLSALDQPTREDLRGVLRELLSGLNIPAVHVTHDRDEALSLGDEIAVVVAGRLRQIDDARQITARPVDPDVAALLGWARLGSGAVAGGTVAIGDLRLAAPAGAGSGVAVVLYRPEGLVLEPAPAPGQSEPALIRTVARVLPTVPLARVELDGTPPLTALVLGRELMRLALRPGDAVEVALPEDCVAAYPG